MERFEHLIKALRCENTGDDECGSSDCPYWSGLGCMDGQLMEDAAAAIEALDRLLDQNTQRCEALRKQLREAHESYERHLNELEAQMPKRGEWVEGDARSVTARCSVCGHLRLGNGAEWANKHVHFCEVCGSRMGGEKE